MCFKPGVDDETDVLSKVENCIEEIKLWMYQNKLKLNETKTELMIIGTRQQKMKTGISSVKVGDVAVTAVRNGRNLGVIFDECMNMKSHVNSICKSAFYKLKNISHIRKYLSTETTVMLVHAFITSNLDYCNSLLTGLPYSVLHKLQMVQNAAAKLVFRVRKYDHVTPLLKDLHWLPVIYRIEFKLLLLTFKCLHGKGPEYLCTMLNPIERVRKLRSSSAVNLLKVPRTKLVTCGDRAFSVIAPLLWNKLPDNVRAAKDVDSFKISLKTYLFKKAFNV